MAQYETAVHCLSPLLLDYSTNQRIAGRDGNRSSRAAPHGVYRCKGEDRWCAIAVFTDEEWRSFCRVIENSPLADDPMFATVTARKKNEAALDKLVEEWTINLSAEQVMKVMQAVGVAAGVVATGEDLMENDAQLKHRHFFWEIEHPEMGTYRAPGPYFQASKVPHDLSYAPLLGEHNEYVLTQLLKLSDEEIEELVIEGVIE